MNAPGPANAPTAPKLISLWSGTTLGNPLAPRFDQRV
jgi:hypothetical protein